MDLTHGILKEFSSINRDGDVNLTYSGADKKFKLSFPFKFEKLKVSNLFINP